MLPRWSPQRRERFRFGYEVAANLLFSRISVDGMETKCPTYYLGVAIWNGRHAHTPHPYIAFGADEKSDLWKISRELSYHRYKYTIIRPIAHDEVYAYSGVSMEQ